MRTTIFVTLVLLSALPSLALAQKAMAPASKEGKDAQIRTALSAAPADLARDAKVVAMLPDGKMETLREGKGPLTCMAGDHPVPGSGPMCVDEQGMKWVMSWMRHDARPANDQPGIAYMLKGGRDVSATDPFATHAEHYIDSPAHFMILWPFDSSKTGLSTQPAKTGTWLMWSGTPYAHLMVNGNPMGESARIRHGRRGPER